MRRGGAGDGSEVRTRAVVGARREKGHTFLFSAHFFSFSSLETEKVAEGTFLLPLGAARGAIIAVSIETRVSTVFMAIPENNEFSFERLTGEHTSVDSRGARR